MKRTTPEQDDAFTDTSTLEFFPWLRGVLGTQQYSDPGEDKDENDGHGLFLQETVPQPIPSGDALIARAMHSMSFEERSHVVEELHGVTKTMEEEPVFAERRLQELEVEIAKIRRKEAYDEAFSIFPAFVEDRQLRLQFLRCERFDPKASAARFVGFFEQKRNLFGSDLLTKPIQMKDLSSDDMACLRNGASQHWPVRDRAGRAVFCHMQAHNQYKSAENALRAFWYILMSAVEDEETQRNGMIFISYNIGSSKASIDRNLAWRLPIACRCLPVNLKGIHMCTNGTKAKVLRSIVTIALSERVKQRMRFYDGTHVECRYQLLSFGIPVEYLPVTENGDLKTANHSKWIKRRKAKEQAFRDGESFNNIDLPTNRDVLIAQGKPFQFHPGTTLMYKFIDDNMSEYERRERGDKRNVVKRIVQLVKDGGGRFLKKDKVGWWVEVLDSAAVQKVTLALIARRTKHSTVGRTDGSMALSVKNGKKARIMTSPTIDCMESQQDTSLLSTTQAGASGKCCTGFCR